MKLYILLAVLFAIGLTIAIASRSIPHQDYDDFDTYRLIDAHMELEKEERMSILAQANEGFEDYNCTECNRTNMTSKFASPYS